MYSNKTLLITGGTGSFGNAVLNGFLSSGLKEIRIFSRDEKKQEDMRIMLKNAKLNFIIGDIKDYHSINQAIQGVDYVFHAAALKQVPSCEFYPMQAVKTNIVGTENVLEACANNGVSRVVVLSTDKAVYPINAMGISKAMMEKLMISKARDPRVKKIGATYTATRYGNVMASRGSIIPLLIKQIKEGAPLTITNPAMTRFIMSLSDSVELVNYAFHNGTPGDIFIQKSPATSIKILAECLLEIFQANNPIKIIGERHSEKLFETLCSKEEMSKAEDLKRYYRIPPDLRDLNYTKYINEVGPKLSNQEYNSNNTKQLTKVELKKILLQLDFVKQELVKSV